MSNKRITQNTQKSKRENIPDYEILEDRTKRGRVIDWRGKKMLSDVYADALEMAGADKKAARVRDCGNYLLFVRDGDRLRLKQAYFCRDRLCQMCVWRKSLVVTRQNSEIVRVANDREKLVWLHLTLTVRNSDGQDLPKTIDAMMKAWNRFVGYAKIKKGVVGWFRGLEITKNTERYAKDKKGRSLADADGQPVPNEWYGTYHPHFHALICVRPSYFKKHYISKMEWVQMWQKAMRLDYEPSVWVERIKAKNVDRSRLALEVEKEVHDAIEQAECEELKLIAEYKAVREVSKYPTKGTDIIDYRENGEIDWESTVNTILDLHDAIKSKRFLAYGGLLKEIRKELHLKDVEKASLIHIDDESDKEDKVADAIEEVCAYWHYGIKNYVIKK